MSEHIVHTGVVEDAFALTGYLSGIPKDFADAMQKNLGFARLGSVTVAGDRYSFRLLEEFRPVWDLNDEVLAAKFAFVMGWVSHRACDRIMKPIWAIQEIFGRGSDADPSLSPTECSVYHEGKMYNLYFADRPAYHYAIFNEDLQDFPGAELFDLDLTQSYIEGSFGMNMMNIQNFPPPPEGQRFIEDVCMQAQKFYVDIERYRKAAGYPDSDKLKKFVTDINWYDEKDEIIKLAVMLRNGELLAPGECDACLTIEPASHYGRTLRLSLQYFLSASEYLQDKSVSMDTLKDKLDIGKKGPGGLGV